MMAKVWQCQECGNTDSNILLVDVCLKCKTNFVAEPEKLKYVDEKSLNTK
jgi:predicted Zn-ribbon and HTH transcriptional regulator